MESTNPSLSNSVPWLLCRAGRLLALPLENVVEVMRLLPVEPLPGMPSFIDGLCIIRGTPVPIVNAASLFGEIGRASCRERV